jgi:hypothetical protein
MRLAFLLSLALVSSSCAPYSPYWVAGTADYTATSSQSRGPNESGALPLEVLYCPRLHEPDANLVRPKIVGLGDRCVVVEGQPGGACDLPTKKGPIRVLIKSAYAALTPRYRSEGVPLNVVVGGEAADGSYVSYRFSGNDVRNGAPAECDALIRPLPEEKPPPSATR